MVISTLLHFLEQSPQYPRDMPIRDSCPHAPDINTWVRSVTRLTSPFNPGLAMQESGKFLAPEVYMCSPLQMYPFGILIWLLFSCLLVCEIRIHTAAQAGLELNLAASASQILGLQIPITLVSYRSVQTLTGVVIWVYIYKNFKLYTYYLIFPCMQTRLNTIILMFLCS